MSTEFINDQWRLPNEENKSKVSNYSMDFDSASSDYIDVGTISSLNASTNFSISLWFKENVRKTSGFMFSSGTGTSNDIGINAGNGTLKINVGGVRNVNITSYSSNVWYHVVLTVENTTAKVYLNNGSPTTVTVGSNTSSSSGTLAKIGDLSFASGYYFDGQIDAVSIFNYALSQSQVTTLYGSSSTGIGNPMSLSPKPVAYYPLGDQDAFNGSNYLISNSSLKDYVFDFDGGNDRISIPEFTFSGEFTLSMWINPSTIGSITYIIGRWNGNYDNDIKLFISNNTPVITFRIGGTAMTFYGYQTSSTIPLNKWSNLSIIRNSSNDINCYLNGVQFSNTTGSSTNTLTLDSIGKITDNATSSGWDGLLSNIQFFNTSLSSTEIQTLYNNGSPIKTLANIPQNSNLQGWWKLDASATYDGTNWTIEDHAGSNDGTSSGMTQANLVQSDLSFTSGYSPYALDFDGTNDYIDCGSASYLNGLSQLTLSCWFKLDTAATNKTIVSDWNYNSSPFGHFALQTQDPSGTTFGLILYIKQTTDAGVNFIRTGGGVFNENTWHHFVFVYDGSAGSQNSDKVKIYKDGASIPYTNGGTIPSTLTNQNGNLLIGDFAGLNRFWNGSLSNLSVWNSALTSAQVTEIYNEGVPSNLNNHSAYSNLVSWWQLGSNSSFNSSLNQWTCIDEKGTNTGESSQTFGEDAIVDGVGSYANGVSSGMSDNIVGDAPYSSSNSLSVNMDVLDRVEDTPS